MSKIVNAFNESYDRLSPTGSVVEIGAGTGALSSLLRRSHEGMLAVEIDERAVEFLRDAHPDLDVLHADVLGLDWDKLAGERGRPLAIVGNLPYNIVSQIMFSMFEARAGSLSFAVGHDAARGGAAHLRAYAHQGVRDSLRRRAAVRPPDATLRRAEHRVLPQAGRYVDDGPVRVYPAPVSRSP